MKSDSSNLDRRAPASALQVASSSQRNFYCAVRIFRWKSQKIREEQSIRRSNKTQRHVSQTEHERDGYCYREFRYVTWRYRREAGKNQWKGLVEQE